MVVGSAYGTLVQYVRVAERTADGKAERGLYRFASGIGKAPGKRDLARGPFNKMPGFKPRERARVERL